MDSLPSNLHRPTVSIIAAAQEVGVSRRTIYNWMADGKVEYIRTASGRVRIYADSLWQKKGAAHGQAPV